MSATVFTRPLDEPFDGLRLRPAEGWVTLAMVALLVETFAWSLMDSGWIPENQGSTGYLFWLALGGVGIELVGAKAGWGRWRTHVVGAVLAGLLLPLVAGIVVQGASNQPVDLTDLAGIYHTAGNVAYLVWADLVRDNRPFTSQFGHYHMVFGGLVWAAGMVASSAVFQRRRPFDAVVVVGVLLLANMIITAGDTQLLYLVEFSIAALILLVRAHTFEEQQVWVRRRIGDPSAISGLYLQNGAVFVAVAVFAAVVLQWSASSSPLQGMWSDLPQRLVGLSQWIQRFAPSGGQFRGIGEVGFGSSAATNGVWQPNNANAFTAVLPSDVTTTFKWKAGTYSTYDGVNRWTWDDTGEVNVPAGQDVLAGSADDPSQQGGRRQVVISITPDAYVDATILSPNTVLSVDRDTTVILTGDRFTSLASGQTGGTYTVTASILDLNAADGVTQNDLRASPRQYPSDVMGTYLDVPPGTLGSASLKIFDEVQAIAASADGPPGNPYDFAKSLESYEQSGRFTYKTDVRVDVRSKCEGLSSVECFATIREGYCEYYASLMTMLLRHDGIPARIAYGFLPGKLQDGTEVVSASGAHWWVEAYFTGYGWMEFDPTGSVGVPQILPVGAKETPRPLASQGRTDRLGIERGGNDGTPAPRIAPGAGPTQGGGAPTSGTGPFAVVGILLTLAVVLVAWTARRRAPRQPMDPDHAWGGLGRLAGRFGLGPRPTQTVYEYAGALGEAVPSMQAELSTVARAKVEVAYGGATLGPDRLRAVGEAYRRLRFAILRRGIGGVVRRRR